MSDVAVGALIGGGFALIGLIFGKVWDLTTESKRWKREREADVERWERAQAAEHRAWRRDRRAEAYASLLPLATTLGASQAALTPEQQEALVKSAWASIIFGSREVRDNASDISNLVLEIDIVREAGGDTKAIANQLGPLLREVLAVVRDELASEEPDS